MIPTLEAIEGTCTRVSDLSEFVKTLTEDERRFLAMHARYQANVEVDWRYTMHMSSEERAATEPNRQAKSVRWRVIADAFHPDPWDNDRLEVTQ